MNKQQFLEELKNKLSGLPQSEVEERIVFYSEMIDDRTEEGLSEEDAVSQVGSVDDVASQIINEIPLTKIVKEKIKPKRKLRVWEIVLLIAGSPIWVSLLIAAAAVAISIYASVWAVLISLWATALSVGVTAICAVLLSVVMIAYGNVPGGLALLGSGIFCAGLTIFLTIGCIAATKGILILTKKAALGIKSLFIRKDDNNE